MDFKTKLEPFRNELLTIFDEVDWYGSKADLTTVENNQAILNYLTNKGVADVTPHFWRVTFNLYAGVDRSDELADFGYEQVTEIAIDDNLNNLVQYTKDVVVL